MESALEMFIIFVHIRQAHSCAADVDFKHETRIRGKCEQFCAILWPKHNI